MTQIIYEQVYISHWPVQEMLLAYQSSLNVAINAGIILLDEPDYFLLEEPVPVPQFDWSWMAPAVPVIPQTVAVPDVSWVNTGDLYTDALFALTSVGLVQSPTPHMDSSLTIPKDGVISQDPDAGTVVPLGTSVALLLSSGPAPGFRVTAVNAGSYAGVYYRPGDVFDIKDAHDFSDSSVDYGTDTVTNQFGWMQRVDPTTPLFQSETDDTSPFYPVNDANKRTIY